MRDRPAAADMVWNVFDVSHGTRPGRHVHGRDLEAYAVSCLELVRGRDNLDAILQHFSGRYGLDRCARKLVKWLPGSGAFLVQCAIRGLEPSARELSLLKIGWDVTFALARRHHRYIGA